MGRRHKNCIDDTVLEFPRALFWIIHVIGPMFIFILGMRFAIQRAPVPMVAYRLLRRLMDR
ncbi:hypothetical protein [Pelosinus propionicus]|uniref:Uncharacterized protein n=1 Tax=Pelosinus propionicus DSM 13327 TaxID=1123291 RepID=A0A1I4PVM1_9FIRM|nr:hypothetical protein [Pelosinus propionicus]SFM31395.1 hypothetical protein SAMN04490355_10737 [Pelosinus propionicus DSM 13327]